MGMYAAQQFTSSWYLHARESPYALNSSNVGLRAWESPYAPSSSNVGVTGYVALSHPFKDDQV